METVNIQPILDIMPKNDRKRSNLCDLFRKHVAEIVKWRQSLNMLESPVHKMVRPMIDFEMTTIDTKLEELMNIIDMASSGIEIDGIETKTLKQEDIKNVADVLETLKEMYGGMI